MSKICVCDKDFEDKMVLLEKLGAHFGDGGMESSSQDKGMSYPNPHLPEGLDYMFFRKLKPEPELQRGEMFVILQAVDLP